MAAPKGEEWRPWFCNALQTGVPAASFELFNYMDLQKHIRKIFQVKYHLAMFAWRSMHSEI
jgi:hypothetical protein